MQNPLLALHTSIFEALYLRTVGKAYLCICNTIIAQNWILTHIWHICAHIHTFYLNIYIFMHEGTIDEVFYTQIKTYRDATVSYLWILGCTPCNW